MTKKNSLITWIEGELTDAKARDLITLPVHNKTTITDYMIICTGTSNRHVKAIADKVTEHAKKKAHPPLSVEGEQSAEWIVVDLGEVIIHVMQQETRDFYQLEKLWG